MLNENIEIEKFIDICHTKSKKHHTNSLNSRKWDNILNFTSTLIMASTSLTMPLLAISGESAINVAIAGNLFAFLGAIIGALKQNYGFVTLVYQHSHLNSEFSDLENEFRNLQRRHGSVESRYYNDDDLEKLIIKFQGINSRSNIQSVKECKFGCCCYI